MLSSPPGGHQLRLALTLRRVAHCCIVHAHSRLLFSLIRFGNGVDVDM